MKTYYFNSDEYQNTDEYKNFINNNPSYGMLKIRAYTASEAVPVIGLKIVVDKVINDDRVIFFEGQTDNSGMIDKIKLPAPGSDENNMNSPLYTTYNIIATYKPDNLVANYKANLYEGICVIQNINLVPEMNKM